MQRQVRGSVNLFKDKKDGSASKITYTGAQPMEVIMAKIVIIIIIGIIISLMLMSVGEGEGLFASIAAAVGLLLLGIILFGTIVTVWFFGGAAVIAMAVVGFGLFVCLDGKNSDDE